MKDTFSHIVKRKIIDWFKTIKLYRYYRLKLRTLQLPTKLIIVMLDGRMLHGGLSDRFWGIVSTYKYCKEHNISFKINFSSPYSLETYLLPRKVDWLIAPSEIRYSFPLSKPHYMSMVYYNRENMYRYASKILYRKCHQLHLYTNMRAVADNEFQLLFHELFKMSPKLEQSVNYIRTKIGSNYISITFRFQQLLGDFKEGNFPILSCTSEKKRLIGKCITTVKQIIKHHNCRVLVTSDSISFLEQVRTLKNVFVIPGKVVHLDFNPTQEYKVHEKSFLDLFLISMADDIYLANFKPLYHSGFPMTAALIGGKRYHEISM